ncbi:hypothetical protein ANO11243_085060 [Dothideomycetidae sp. 11243]|nr:hypothetical protein ANO11243_085060 [fungal sp. No.11243]
MARAAEQTPIKYQLLPNAVGNLLKGTYSTTASVPVSSTTSFVYTTGHIGLDLQTGALVHETLEAEFNAIFNCLNAALKGANVRDGCAGAFKFTSYLLKAEHEPVMQAVFKQRWPQHRPTWTTVIVADVAGGGCMHAEIAAEAAAFT